MVLNLNLSSSLGAFRLTLYACYVTPRRKTVFTFLLRAATAAASRAGSLPDSPPVVIFCQALLKAPVRQFISFCNPSSKDGFTLVFLCFPTLAWWVWRERNFSIFRRQARSMSALISEILNSIRSRAIFLGL